ncbi:hypothetical protein JCM11251_002799 [Rhodosporidiobolus azoricus]
MNLYSLASFSRFASLPSLIRHGFSLGISPLSPTASSYTPHNNLRTAREQQAARGKVVGLVAAKKLYGPFSLRQLEEEMGPVQSSPIKVVPKEPLPGTTTPRDRLVENFTFPYQPTPDGHEAVNQGIDPDIFVCGWVSWREVAAFYLSFRDQPDVKFLGLDLKDGFEHLDLHPSIRHRLVLKLDEDEFYVRTVGPFGLRSIPGEFVNAVEFSIRALEKHFDERVKIVHHVDDLSIAIIDPSIAVANIIAFLNDLGWVINEAQTEQPTRSPTHVGCVWDVDAAVVTIKDSKRLKYLRKLDEAIALDHRQEVTLKMMDSLAGSLGYVTFVKREWRTFLRGLYRFRNGFKDAHRRRSFRHNEIALLKTWKGLLEQGPVSASFAALPPFLEGTLASDASNEALGIWIDRPEQVSPLFRSFRLVDDWRTVFDAYIGNAESWAVEALVEALIKMGVRNHTLVLLCDNLNVVQGWQKGWSHNRANNLSFRRLFAYAFHADLHLEIEYVSTHDNPADAISRLNDPEDATKIPDDSPFLPLPPPGTVGGPSPFCEQPLFLSSAETS